MRHVPRHNVAACGKTRRRFHPTPPQPNAYRPGSPHSKKLRLTPCAAGTTKFRTSTPQYRLWNQNGTIQHAFAFANSSGNRSSAQLHSPKIRFVPRHDVAPCGKTRRRCHPTPSHPNASRPGSPHSKKLKLTPCAAGTTKFRPSTPKYRLWNQNGTPLVSVLLWQPGGNRQSAASQPAEKLVANPNASRPGSPHSKKLKLTPCAAGTTKFRTSAPQYRL